VCFVNIKSFVAERITPAVRAIVESIVPVNEPPEKAADWVTETDPPVSIFN